GFELRSEVRHRRAGEGPSTRCCCQPRRRNATAVVPSRRQFWKGYRAMEPCGRSQRETNSISGARSAFQCRLATSPFAAGMIGLSPQYSSKESGGMVTRVVPVGKRKVSTRKVSTRANVRRAKSLPPIFTDSADYEVPIAAITPANGH